jgi:uncharacterized protein (DUF983 family)
MTSPTIKDGVTPHCPNCNSLKIVFDSLNLAHCDSCGWDELDGESVDE